jgi:hypothetical protein
MSESYTGGDFQQQASSSKRRRRPIYIAPKNRSILRTESEAAVFSLVRLRASIGQKCFTGEAPQGVTGAFRYMYVNTFAHMNRVNKR